MAKPKKTSKPEPPKETAPPDVEPNWEVKCEVCEALPTVGDMGLCGPCCFGEAATAGGNWQMIHAICHYKTGRVVVCSPEMAQATRDYLLRVGFPANELDEVTCAVIVAGTLNQDLEVRAFNGVPTENAVPRLSALERVAQGVLPE